MAGNEIERVEIDHLIRELSAPPKPTPKPAPVKPAAPAPVPASPAAPVAARHVTQLPRLPAGVRRSLAMRVAADTEAPPPSRWSQLAATFEEVRLPELPKSFSFPFPRRAALPRFRLPALPDIVTPSQATTVRLWVGLGVALAMAMPFWPYPKTSALWVAFYMFAVVMVVVAGVWSARLTWAQRLGGAHIVAIAIVLWGITLYAEETLPLIG